MTIDRVIELIEGKIESEQNKAEQANVEGEGQWVVAHTYAEIVLGRIVEQIKQEEANNAT